MIQAAIPLDIRIVLLAANASDGAAQVCPNVLVGRPDDPVALQELAQQCDVITFDHELVDPALLAGLERAGHTVLPSSCSMALAQDKRRQRRELGEIGVPMPISENVQTVDGLRRFGDRHGWPIVIKASWGGYDGRGVWVVNTADQAAEVWRSAQEQDIGLLVEEHLQLEREFAILLARRPNGEIALYPPIETVQQDGICRQLKVPSAIAREMVNEALELARAIAEHVGIVGILAIEMFVADGRILVNELAPRPHNSGHWSIDGAVTSQFEQHLRAVLDVPLGSTDATAPAVVMSNILGRGDGADPRDLLPRALAFPTIHVHLYGKEPRAGRKIGHITVLGTEMDSAARMADDAVRAIGGKAE